MVTFAPLLDLLAEVPDPRRTEGKLYKLPHVLLFSILAVGTGRNSYRGIANFIDVQPRKLNNSFGLKWRRTPTHTAIRTILQALDPPRGGDRLPPPCSPVAGGAGRARAGEHRP